MALTGIRFLFSLFLQLLPIQVLAYVLLTLSEQRTSLNLNFVSKVILSVLASFVQVVLERGYKALLIRNDAHRLGARRPPLLPSKRIGGLDILQDMLHEVEHGYLANQLTKYFEKMGHIFRMKIFGDTQASSHDDGAIGCPMLTSL
jgi:hypothetical protein